MSSTQKCISQPRSLDRCKGRSHRQLNTHNTANLSLTDCAPTVLTEHLSHSHCTLIRTTLRLFRQLALLIDSLFLFLSLSIFLCCSHITCISIDPDAISFSNGHLRALSTADCTPLYRISNSLTHRVSSKIARGTSCGQQALPVCLFKPLALAGR